ncbi:GNAT family N-acetyltransferase [Listeria ivanovii]|uniref:GNAT family N-acetyltransferase n=2 Tax=Listeria ivanovii TaxID=1638 RepID=A0ABS1G7I8_LISIV|nr:GNAT family N-acetyltransferase [Listeria ivanovii]EFR98364.1 acetyltransferase [Listeria ivanovii FSL F6-596]AIS58676.1 GNAT family acetyltransferase [Listeria ivanovii subsp. londoniensis]AIS61482.1 GNAT family acetyltransferase [Listeria ivanovii subsp. londoniensis]MBC2256616.1 GNAT family N-acetyltransferase [Listeria ivanovii]MBK1962847.1 GNAT family N-acetyltransferase [Listeria ivanovii subsp. londoniensis]
MLDKSVPHLPAAMVNDDAMNYPKFSLPAGYSFRFYEDGLEEAWCQLQLETGQAVSVEAIRERFKVEFGDQKEKLAKRCVFVQASDGEIVGTAMLWDGDTFGEMKSRIHWVAVLDSHGGKGIAKALLTKILRLNKNNFVYLTTQTGSYQAIYLYQKFGFTKYTGETPKNWKTANFQKQNETAWQIIENKIIEYKH